MNALDKKARRKSHREMRKVGIDPVKFDLKGAQVRAESKFHKLEVLNHEIDHGDTNARLAAQKAKRTMNDKWFNQQDCSANGYYLDDQTFRPIDLDIKKRYLRIV